MLNHHLIIWQLSYKVSNNKNNIRIKLIKMVNKMLQNQFYLHLEMGL
jgi:hypothetical protein